MADMGAMRDPADWVEDAAWHRRMFGQSHFRWVPEDPMSIMLVWTRGRLVYDRPGHLRFLDAQLLGLRDFAAGIDDAMVPLLREAQRECSAQHWAIGLGLIDMTQRDVSVLRHGASAALAPAQHREASRALQGIPLANPFSQVWELRQMRAMYAAAEDLIEDVFCDLAVELSQDHDWDELATHTRTHHSGRTLQMRVTDQREIRGMPGDARRIPEQCYSALTLPPS